MKSFFEDLGRKIGETAGTVTNKAGEAVEVQRLRNQIRALERVNERDYMELGRMMYQHYQDGEEVNAESIAACEAIQKREESISKYEQQISDVKGDMTCDGCGKSVAKEMSFCPYCGAKAPENAGKEATDYADVVKGKVIDMAEKVKETAESVAGAVKEKADEAVGTVREKTADTAENMKDRTEDTAESVKNKTEDAADTMREKAEDIADKVKEKTADAAEAVKGSTSDASDAIKEKASGIADAVKEKAADVAETVKEKAGEAEDKLKKMTED